MYNGQDETGRDNDNNIGLNGNLVQEGNIPEEGDFQNQLQLGTSGAGHIQTGSENSIDKYIEKFHNNPKFSEKEKEFSQKVDNFIKSKTGKTFSSFSGYIFMANKILLLSTMTEFLFQRFDIVTLYLNLVIISIELGIFSQKHIYKWLLVLIGSLILDALVLLDISPVSKNIFFKFHIFI